MLTAEHDRPEHLTEIGRDTFEVNVGDTVPDALW
jgi:hypothetical protein